MAIHRYMPRSMDVIWTVYGACCVRKQISHGGMAGSVKNRGELGVRLAGSLASGLWDFFLDDVDGFLGIFVGFRTTYNSVGFSNWY